MARRILEEYQSNTQNLQQQQEQLLDNRPKQQTTVRWVETLLLGLLIITIAYEQLYVLGSQGGYESNYGLKATCDQNYKDLD